MSLIERLTDRWFRLTNLYSIRDEGGKIIPFEPRLEQLQFFQKQAHRNYVLKARKLGLSTFICIDNLDACIFSPGTHAAIVDRTEKEAQDKLQIARLAWEQMTDVPNDGARSVGVAIHKRLKLLNDSDGEMVFSNGSRFEAGVSLRGGTPQRLHVSELGPIAARDRKRAEEIRAGSINAVPPSGSVTIETTHEGGKVGTSYDLAKLAMDQTAEGLESPMDWQFHFFPWFDHPSYTIDIPNPRVGPETLKYFEKLKADYGVSLSPQRMAWYEAKQREQKEAMFREFPSTPDEAFRALVAGAIYPQMMTARATSRISTFEPDANAPFVTSWDLGISDYTSIWLIQFVGREILWLDWHEGEGLGVGRYADVIRKWERIYGREIATHYLPHDANTRERSGTTSIEELVKAGLPAHTLQVVPRTPDVWTGINALRDLIPRSWFHSRCDEPRKAEDGSDKLSGIGCLEAYRKGGISASGILHEDPVHDHASHSADAARTIAEAFDRGMITARSGSGARRAVGLKPQVITGIGGSERTRATVRR